MAIEFVTQELPFTVEAPAPKRVQLWSKFAGQASTGNEMSIVQAVYSGFWWELAAVNSIWNVQYWFRALQSSGDRGDAGRVASWMDLLAHELAVASDVVASVVGRFSSGEVSAPRFANDVYRHHETLQELLQQIRLYGVSLCQQWGFEVPEHLAQASTSPTVPAVGEGGERL